MTGYGQAAIEAQRFECRVEIKSLNSKFFELNLRMPRNLQYKELELRRDLQKQIERGTVSVFINVNYKLAEDKVNPLNLDVAEYYLKELNHLSELSGRSADQLFKSVFEFPNILSSKDEEPRDEDYKEVLTCVNAAFQAFDQFRIQEGAMLAIELERMVGSIEQKLEEITPFEQERITLVKERLMKELAKLPSEMADRNRFEQELIYYLEKLDISEEKSRLAQHCTYFRTTMQDVGAGKKLGFIAQEMGREINTIGSKSNHSAMQRKVVEMKDELEKIKEQINNIL